MQNVYANCIVKAKTLWLSSDGGSIHVRVEEKWRVQLSKKFDSFSSYITAIFKSFKLIKI